MMITSHTDSKESESQMLKSSSQISRNGHKILPVGFVLYILLQMSVNFGTQCNNSNGSHEQLTHDRTEDYFLCAGFAFSVSAIQHLCKAICCQKTDSTSSHKKFMLHVAAVTISLIAGSSSLLTYVYCYGICRFNIEAANQWSQWIICVPLLAYIVISGEEKECLSFLDKALIISILVVFLCMLLNSFTFTNNAESRILCILCCLFLVIPMLLALMKAVKLREKSVSFFVSSMNNSLLKLTWGILPCLVLLFLMGYFNGINRDHLQIGHVFLSVIVNLIFLNYIVDEQIHVALKTTFLEEAEALANLERRTFLR
jgi:hypothetical protein